MPNLPAHIDLAKRAAERLGHRTLGSNLGYYPLGSTSPDVRVITRRDRQEYHFAPLNFDRVGDGVGRLLEAHPDLAGTDGAGPRVAFVAGYITHLLLDEFWIVQIFRPYFGNPDVFGDGVRGKVMDRALQLELDRLSQQAVEVALPVLEQATAPIEVGFISPQTISEWRQWVLGLLGRGFNWERLRFMARRIAAGDEAHPAHGVAEEFLQAMPQSLDRLYQHVTRDGLSEFRERSVERLSAALEDYLS